LLGGQSAALRAATPVPADPQAARAARAAERDALREKLDVLRRAIAAGEATRSEAADALAASERSISDLNRQLRELDVQQRALQTELGQLGDRQKAVEARAQALQKRLATLLRQRYLAGGQDALKLLFSGTNPHQVERDLHYQTYIAHAQADMLRELRASLDTLHDLADQARERDAALARIATARQAQRAALQQEQQTRRTLLANIAEKLRLQRREAGALERDEKRLGRVVEELARVIERQAGDRELARQRARERRPELARSPDPKAGTAKTPTRPSAPAAADAADHNELVADASGNLAGSFAQLKGRLRLPLRGDITGRFGARRDGGPSWKGVFIRAAQGAEVRAVAPGRVVFAEWLRGFGNLLIIDHGDQYLSIYGNNEALLRQPGDRVGSGEAIATTGNSGGNPETGLYFELRFQGRPFDPLTWARLR